MVSQLFFSPLTLCVLVGLYGMLHVRWAKPGLPTPPVAAQAKRKRSSEPTPPTTRRPRTVDTSRHGCPHLAGDYRGWLGLHTLRAHGHPRGGPWRPLHGRSCHGSVPEHHGTSLPGPQAPGERIVRVLACRAEGLGLRATARGFAVDANTGRQWRGEAAEQLQAFSYYYVCDVHGNQWPLD